MPKMPLNVENKAKNNFDFPKLSLDFGARARIALIETQPFWEWTHTLKAPQIVNGEPVMETVTDQKTKETRQVMKQDFVGRHICIGDPEVIGKKQLDAAGCPVCAESQNSDAVKPPERRFAMNVISYQLKHGTFTVQDPFQVELLVWAFNDFTVNKLIDFQVQWEEQGGLQQHDLMLGPCENKQWQKFDINVAPDAQWLKSDERKKLTAEVYKNNALDDLSVAIGRRLSPEQVREDLERVLDRYSQAHNLNRGTAHEREADVSQAISQVAVDDILSGANEEKEPEAAAVLDLDSLINMDL